MTPRSNSRRASDSDLLLVGKSKNNALQLLQAGAKLESRTGYSVDQLVSKSAADRLVLAQTFLRAGKAATTGPNPSFRSATSRAYYSMYHAVRAAAFVAHEGDDHEQHSKLPAGIPDDFPKQKYWQNDLKSARLDRNRADYDPYPRNDVKFQHTANELLRKAEELSRIVRSYLRSKGCDI